MIKKSSKTPPLKKGGTPEGVRQFTLDVTVRSDTNGSLHQKQRPLGRTSNPSEAREKFGPGSPGRIPAYALEYAINQKRSFIGPIKHYKKPWLETLQYKYLHDKLCTHLTTQELDHDYTFKQIRRINRQEREDTRKQQIENKRNTERLKRSLYFKRQNPTTATIPGGKSRCQSAAK